MRREKTLEEELAAAKQSAEEREAALREEAAEAKQSAEERRAVAVAAVEAERDDFIAQCGALSGAKRNTKKCLFWIAAKKPDHFTKSSSGQTSGKVEAKRFLAFFAGRLAEATEQAAAAVAAAEAVKQSASERFQELNAQADAVATERDALRAQHAELATRVAALQEAAAAAEAQKKRTAEETAEAASEAAVRKTPLFAPFI